jgi:Carboxypeptidase regulatory-like domain
MSNSFIMKNLFLTIILLCNVIIAKAGAGIYGNIVSNTNKPVAGINIYLLDANGEALALIISNADGDYGFEIAKEGNYSLQIMLTDSTFQKVENITVAAKPIYYDFLVNNINYSRDKNIASITAAELEKMPTQDVKKMIATKGNFDTDANGNLRSRTLGNGVRLIVDGQVMSDNSGIQFVPGSIGSMEVLKR